jgi:Domain of unknown function (DUF4112)
MASRYYDTWNTFNVGNAEIGTPYSRRRSVERLDALARLLDIAFLVPGTNVRYGVEAIIRLVPGIGDAIASALSCIILYEARRLGVGA